ncbi:hypothetical protein LP52_20420 [Streptomonospora alba]|uniref:Uncharacterized protein n=1 Tax=Streptomonospora alba TaxID=183763 RepID=A0A0C2G1N1_9ACTN|nr:NB-ARC domain-containing protein [Streptomonospora alba]KIH97218.1 hypothetical protein LP52_20420 [Streptomonospora alba]
MPDNTRAAGAARARTRWRLVVLLVALGACAGALAVLGDVFPQAPVLAIIVAGAASGVLGAVGELVRRLSRPEEAPPPTPVPGPRVMDVDSRSPLFVGRDEELQRILAGFAPLTPRRARRGRGRALRRGADGPAGSSGSLVAAITGEPGIGKSELATQIAYAVQDAFPHGILRRELFGAPVGATRAPRRPQKVLSGLLRSIGAAPQRDDIPLESLSQFWKTRTEGLRLLLILDDARDFEQVKPLLPGGDGCAVLITSTDTFLDAPMYVRRHPIGPLTAQAGEELLRRPAGAGADASEPVLSAPGDLAAIARECEGRPLSLALCRGALRNGVSTRQLLKELRRDHGATLFSDHGVAAAFRVLLRERSEDERLLLFRLAQTGLTSVAPWAAAALLKKTEPEATALLEELCNRHLLRRAHREGGPSLRYRPVKELTSILRTDSGRSLGAAGMDRLRWSHRSTVRATDRLLAAYARFAEATAISRSPSEWGFGEPPRLPVPGAASDPRLPDAQTPAEWFAQERQQIQICLGLRHSSAPLAVEWRLQRALAAHCRTGRVYWADWRAALERASRLALQMDNRHAYGISLLERAELAGNEGHHGSAVELARQAQAQLAHGDERWEARARRAIGVNRYRLGDRDDGEGELRAAEAVFARSGDRWWLARTRCNLGELNRFRGDHLRAHGLLTEARSEFAELDDAEQAAKAGLLLGEVLGHMGRDLEAWLTLRGVRDALERSGGSWYRARCLRAMGRLDTRRLRLQYDDCDLVLSPERAKERDRSLRDFLFRGTLGTFGDEKAVARLTDEWRRARRELVRRNLGTDHWPGCTAGWDGGGLPRWFGEQARRLCADRAEWTDEAGVARAEEAHALLVEAGDEWGGYRTRLILGELRIRTDVHAGLRDMEAAAEGFERLGHQWWKARAWRHTADALYRHKHYRQAKEKAVLAMEGYRGLSNLSGRLRAQVLLGYTLSALGENRAALDVLEEARADASRGREQGIVPDDLLQAVEDARARVVGEEFPPSAPART